MNSIIYLYNTRIIKERNMCVDSLETYLRTCSPVSVDAFQYIKIAPSLSIKVAVNQSVATLKSASYNYCKIVNMDTASQTYYFFIDSFEWVAEDTIKLNLTMDVLNTFHDSLVGGALGTKTQVIREHRDRFQRDEESGIIQKVDRISEGMNYPLLKTYTQSITQSPNCDWYNIFIQDGTSDTAGILRITAPSTALDMQYTTYAGSQCRIDCSLYPLLATNQVAFFVCLGENNNLGTIDALAYSDTQSGLEMEYSPKVGTTRIDGNNTTLICYAMSLFFFLNNGVATLKGLYYWYSEDLAFVETTQMTFENPQTHAEIDSWPIQTGLHIAFENCGIVRQGSLAGDFPESLVDIMGLPKASLSEVATQTTATGTLAAFSSVFQNDPLTSKIIAYPYAPFALTYSNNLLYVPSNYAVFGSKILCKELKIESNQLTFTPYTAFKNHFISYGPASRRTLVSHSQDNESKLLNSEFTIVKLVYDSFYYDWKQENLLYIPAYDDGEITINLNVSGSMLSEFSFTLANWAGGGVVPDYYDSDFDCNFIVTRNNELSIYSSAYLSYLRSGYNYDQKKNAIAAQQQGFNVAINALSVVASAAATAATNGVAAPALISSATSLTTSIVNAGVSEYNREQSQAQKIKELIEQGVSVSGCTDFDIMKSYNSNRVQLMLYEMPQQYKDAAYNIMRLTGYASEGQYAPSVTTRTLYNYLQCVPDFSTALGCAIPANYRELLTARLAEGVTFFHVSPWSTITYDFDQIYENWEANLPR